MVLGELEIRTGVEKDDIGIDKEVSDDFADVRESPVRTNPTNKSSITTGSLNDLAKEERVGQRLN